MKKQIILTLFLILSVTTFAQQALFGAQSIISPQVNADNTVTFRL